MLRVGQVFELGFAVVKGVMIFVVALIAGQRVHNLAVHFDSDGLTVADEPSGGVEAVLTTNKPPVVPAEPFKVFCVYGSVETTADWDSS